MIIAVDFDGTLQRSDGKPNGVLFQRLKASQRRGDIIILWTCREGRRLQEAVEFMQKNGLRPNYINDNCPEAIRRLKGNPRKIYADIYLDNKGI